MYSTHTHKHGRSIYEYKLRNPDSFVRNKARIEKLTPQTALK